MKKKQTKKTQLQLKKFKISRITNLSIIKGGGTTTGDTPDDWTKPSSDCP